MRVSVRSVRLPWYLVAVQPLPVAVVAVPVLWSPDDLRRMIGGRSPDAAPVGYNVPVRPRSLTPLSPAKIKTLCGICTAQGKNTVFTEKAESFAVYLDEIGNIDGDKLAPCGSVSGKGNEHRLEHLGIIVKVFQNLDILVSFAAS